MFRIELHKLLTSRHGVLLLIATTVIFPSTIAFISRAHAIYDKVPEGLFIDHVAYAVLMYSQSYFFVPVWIIFLMGREFSNRYCSRMCFVTSSEYYFRSKLVFCTIVTLLFVVLGTVALILSVCIAPFDIHLTPTFLMIFISQLLVSTFSLTIFLMAIIFLFRSAIVGLVFYLCYTMVEATLYTVFLKLFRVDLFILPLVVTRGTFSKSGNLSVENYFQPQGPMPYLMVVVFAVIIASMTRAVFIRRDLQILSD